eukprot:g1372.t1
MMRVVGGLLLLTLLVFEQAERAASLGFKLASEEYLTQTIDGQKYSFKTNPSLEQSITIERISDYEYHHRPRGGDLRTFQDKMAASFGGDFDKQTKVHHNAANDIHSVAWSLIEQGYSRKAGILLDAHKSGDHDRVQLVKDSIPHVSNPDHEAKHEHLQRLVLLENHRSAISDMDLGAEWQCVYATPCKGNKKDVDLTKNGVCRVFGCGSKEVRYVCS